MLTTMDGRYVQLAVVTNASEVAVTIKLHFPREKSRTLITKKGMISCPSLSVAESFIPSGMRMLERTSLPKGPIRIGARCTIKFVGSPIGIFIIVFDEWLWLERPVVIVGASLSARTTTTTTK